LYIDLPRHGKRILIQFTYMSQQPVDKNNSCQFSDSWTQIQTELNSALSLWEDLTHKSRGKKSSEEQQIQEVRELLQSLQDKLKELS
jgi:hypothetical protein